MSGDILKYILDLTFRDFWHWLGMFLILIVIVDGIFVNLIRFFNNIIIGILNRNKFNDKKEEDYED